MSKSYVECWDEIHNAIKNPDTASPELINKFHNWQQRICDENMTSYTTNESNSSVSLKTTIKVIKNNFNKENFDEPEQKIVRTFCDHCHSELEVTPEDTYIGWLGAAYITCPCCGEESMVEELEGITLTKDNIKFPLHFKRCNNTMKDVHDVDNESIEKEICHGIEYLNEHPDEYVWYTSYGDLWMVIHKLSEDEEYYVVVTKDFYDAYIPFGDDDYE